MWHSSAERADIARVSYRAIRRSYMDAGLGELYSRMLFPASSFAPALYIIAAGELRETSNEVYDRHWHRKESFPIDK